LSQLKVRFYIDPVTESPHIYNHDVNEEEVVDVLDHPLEDRPGSEGARLALGQTSAGRYLRVVYVPDPDGESLFVVTAYGLRGKALEALKRRRRKKQQ